MSSKGSQRETVVNTLPSGVRVRVYVGKEGAEMRGNRFVICPIRHVAIDLIKLNPEGRVFDFENLKDDEFNALVPCTDCGKSWNRSVMTQHGDSLHMTAFQFGNKPKHPTVDLRESIKHKKWVANSAEAKTEDPPQTADEMMKDLLEALNESTTQTSSDKNQITKIQDTSKE